jgi:hypothetical protein
MPTTTPIATAFRICTGTVLATEKMGFWVADQALVFRLFFCMGGGAIGSVLMPRGLNFYFGLRRSSGLGNEVKAALGNFAVPSLGHFVFLSGAPWRIPEGGKCSTANKSKPLCALCQGPIRALFEGNKARGRSQRGILFWEQVPQHTYMQTAVVVPTTRYNLPTQSLGLPNFTCNFNLSPCTHPRIPAQNSKKGMSKGEAAGPKNPSGTHRPFQCRSKMKVALCFHAAWTGSGVGVLAPAHLPSLLCVSVFVLDS